ncbi:MAG: ABC transporter ATP-binding protein [Chloroflexota bacterium]|nr:MAG: ABC transporter ATP-binding protein [Chloroflexota bacterium]
MLEIRSVSQSFGSRPVLHEVSLNVEAGQVAALIGPNGAGKTTLLRTASGVLGPKSGSIWICGQDLLSLSPASRASKLAVVPQARNLPEAFTVHQTVLLGRTPYLGWLGQPSKKDLDRTHWALERANLLPLSDRLIGELSGGEQQRVLLARALAQETPILLLDEPTAHLDLRHQASLLQLVQELAHEQGLAVLMALHDLNLVALYADVVALMVAGMIKALGVPKDVLTSENLEDAYDVSLSVVTHPEYGTPLVLPDGFRNDRARD